ncbi:uncharacterized protein LOC115878290 [Sitophilus oryzae]|uniref:Uncharacterized protein LOC115878290 n=1 Tax=Sitophilus oryzae TaxID=7048 RepID=A0A6J2XHL3_SITOR|nr:uncharacterized protein LOC115878290 [Sitophilus oryzae]
MSASGSFIPPLLIFPRKRMSPTLTKHGPVDGIYAVTDNGWSNEKCFLQWLEHFKFHVNSNLENPVLLLLDNHYSHISLPIYNYCKGNGIVMLSIPPHTSHLSIPPHRLQPLDTSFFGPFKCAFNKECDLFLKTGKQEKITFADLAEIFNNAFVKIATMEKAISGFNSTGIYPFNPDKFTKEDFEAASQYLPTVCDDLDSTNEVDSAPSTSGLLTSVPSISGLATSVSSTSGLSTSVPSTSGLSVSHQSRIKGKSRLSVLPKEKVTIAVIFWERKN